MNKLVFTPSQQEAFWKHMFKQNVVRLGPPEEYARRKELLKEIELEVLNGKYSPNPHGFLSQPKGSGVARFLPLFSYKDYAVYFACMKCMDEKLASLSVDDTFGGWSLGGSGRRAEEERAKQLLSKSLAEDSDAIGASMPTSSFDKWSWVKEWNQFWLLMTGVAESSPHDYCFVMFDIANFYDSIDLTRLERELRFACSDSSFAIEVLFHLLSTWNKGLNQYARSTKGLPQDIVGDCSRLLANFYLKPFDEKIRHISQCNNSRFLRYADDMVLACPNKSVAQLLIFEACDYLHSIGLNMNTAKVRFMTKEEFELWWGFPILNNFAQGNDLTAIDQLIVSWDNRKFGRRETALRKSISTFSQFPKQQKYKRWILNKAFEDNSFILRLADNQLKSIVNMSQDKINTLLSISHIILAEPFTQPKAQLLRCIEKMSKEEDPNIQQVIKEVYAEIAKQEDPVLKFAIQYSPLRQDFNSSLSNETKFLLNLSTIKLSLRMNTEMALN